MAKSKSTRRPTDPSEQLSRIQGRAREAQVRLAEIKAQLRVLAAASQAMESGHGDLEPCHVTASLEALMAPVQKLDDVLDLIDMDARGLKGPLLQAAQGVSHGQA
ncbi:MAG TPA: hypothetical protein VN660_00975 [Steroidobacteraceae bacterium]|nr:hypothetical protein [Steroidobacteraceae bacterium]